MTSSVVLTGKSSYLESNFFPPFEIPKNTKCGFISLNTVNSVPNISNNNNKFTFNNKLYEIPVGCYELEDIFDWMIKNTSKYSSTSKKIPPDFTMLEKIYDDRTAPRYLLFDKGGDKVPEKIEIDYSYLIPEDNVDLNNVIDTNIPIYNHDMLLTFEQKTHTAKEIGDKAHKLFIQHLDYKGELKREKQMSISLNKNTGHVEIYSQYPIIFKGEDNLNSVLGFKNESVIEAKTIAYSFYPVQINAINNFNIHCNIISGSYLNDESSQIIHSFNSKVDPGYKMDEVPTTVIYYPVTVEKISTLIIRITDQNNNLVDFRGEEVTVRIHLKQLE